MQAALGIEYGGRHATFLLPHPLLPGEPPRTDENNVKLWNPNWKADANAPENKAFNVYVKSSLENDEKGLEEKDVSLELGVDISNTSRSQQQSFQQVFLKLGEDERLKAVKTYFGHLRKKYREQTEESEKAKADELEQKNTRRARKRRVSIRSLHLSIHA